MMPFDRYWSLYLRAHRKGATRRVHYVATVLGLSSSCAGLIMFEPIVLGIGIAASYALAIASHRIFERNNPMIAVNPIWGAVSDLRMTWLALTGRLAQELRRRGIAEGD